MLGAGISGMAGALAMRRAGWSVTVLEAETRPGGRCLTLRTGDIVREDGHPEQRIGWDAAPHLYFNPGPARIPHHHRAVLGLCRDLGVPLEPLVNENRAASLRSDASGGTTLPLRRVAADLRGTVAELAAKSLTRAALDGPFTEADLGALRSMLRGFGALDADGRYRGSRRAGWAEPPGAASPGVAHAPLDPRLLLDPAFWATASFAEGVDYAATMLQPVGGMDRIAAALHAALGDSVLLGCEVASLRRGGGGGARVAWRQDGAPREARFDRVLCTLPPPLLAALDTDLPPERRAALRSLAQHPAGKLAFHAPRRFWEEDDAIYGGIAWTTGDATQLWYPSHGFHAAGGGVLVGAYAWDAGPALRFAARTPAERAASAASDGEALHPGYAREVAHPVSVSWPNMPRARGAWTEWTEEQRRDLQPMLRAPEGPYHFAGEYLSFLPGWQEGAVLSAWAAVEAMAAG
ncbi:flavin monoamine oxidase family protein [Craurococcus roseus]|uniref:Tryptophan 2-monooxygenase n=1 Tax=Craurococcus roseus TaxID=77585 RepID=A0ABN1G1X0_9PROT